MKNNCHVFFHDNLPTQIQFVQFLNDAGSTHRTDGPAIICYDENGKVVYECYWVDNKLHRIDGPACINYDKDGKVVREEYCIDNKFHRTDGPAVIEYYGSGKVSRERYYINSNLHRTDGPAIVWYDENGNVVREEFWVGNKSMAKSDFEEKFPCSTSAAMVSFILDQNV